MKKSVCSEFSTNGHQNRTCARPREVVERNPTHIFPIPAVNRRFTIHKRQIPASHRAQLRFPCSFPQKTKHCPQPQSSSSTPITGLAAPSRIPHPSSPSVPLILQIRRFSTALSPHSSRHLNLPASKRSQPIRSSAIEHSVFPLISAHHPFLAIQIIGAS